jgi:hypothetical protein
MTKRTPKRRAKRVRGLYYPVRGMTPEKLFRAIGELRREAQDAIDKLLTLLDALEGDTDLEPSLAATPSLDQTDWAGGSSDDREGCAHDDREPSLGSTESVCQAHWSAGENDDCEDQHDDREPNGDEYDDDGTAEPVDHHLTAGDRAIRGRLRSARDTKARPFDVGDGMLVNVRIPPSGGRKILRGCKV